jgi:hypothetical protein
MFSGGRGPVTTALRWNGRDWYKQAIPKWVVFGNLSGSVSAQAAAFSATNLWVFSEGQDKFTNPDHYAARYDGRSWSKVTLPVLPGQVSVVSPTDIWVLGRKLSNLNASMLAHWNAYQWRFYHRTASGQWAEYVAGESSKISLMETAWIPGTRSLWATAETFPSNTTVSAEILKYGA